jgi:hypothetical protein
MADTNTSNANDTNTSTDTPIIDVTGDNLVLTTIDNPYNPKTDYDNWKSYDSDNEYNTEEFVARLLSMEVGFDMDDDMKMNELTNKVINEILEHDMTKMYILV